MTFVEIVLLAGTIVLLGHLIKSVTGFASALFSIPLLALFLDIKFVVPVFLIFDLASGAILTIQNRRFIDKKSALMILSGLVVGTAVGTYLLVSFGNEELKRVFGILVILFALKSLVWDNGEARKSLNRAWAPVAGILGGCTGAMFGLNGPPLVIYLTRQLGNKQAFRATLYGLFFADACYRLVLYSFKGLITIQVLRFSLYLTPFVLVGLLLGSKLHGRIGERFFRKIVAIILLLTGTLLAI